MKLSKRESNHSNRYYTRLLSRHWLTDLVFEIELMRPESFEFEPGQRIRIVYEAIERDYSLINSPTDSTLSICLHNVQGGQLSPLLAHAEIDTEFSFMGPHGYFTYRPSARPTIFVATGTGIAPFLSMARSGVTGFTLLHGVPTVKDLHYEEFFAAAARMYVPCVSREPNQLLSKPNGFHGRITDYLKINLPVKKYDFYLCGRQDMIRDVTLLSDERFPGSFVFTEVFY